MKRILAVAMAGTLAVWVGGGCEWSGGGSGDGWSTTGMSSDISGVYVASDGGFAVKTSGSGNLNASEGFATGNGISKTYSHGLSEQPVVKGSVHVSGGGGETFSDNGSGSMVGSAGGTGSINYDTGAASITYITPPTGDLTVSYQYAGSGASKAVYTFNVQQNGNKVRIETNQGGTLEGTLAVAETASSVSSSSTNTVVTMYQFNATGSISGNSINMTGVFNTGNSTMQATWVEDGGKTGSVNAQRQ